MAKTKKAFVTKEMSKRARAGITAGVAVVVILLIILSCICCYASYWVLNG